MWVTIIAPDANDVIMASFTHLEGLTDNCRYVVQIFLQTGRIRAAVTTNDMDKPNTKGTSVMDETTNDNKSEKTPSSNNASVLASHNTETESMLFNDSGKTTVLSLSNIFENTSTQLVSIVPTTSTSSSLQWQVTEKNASPLIPIVTDDKSRQSKATKNIPQQQQQPIIVVIGEAEFFEATFSELFDNRNKVQQPPTNNVYDGSALKVMYRKYKRHYKGYEVSACQSLGAGYRGNVRPGFNLLFSVHKVSV